MKTVLVHWVEVRKYEVPNEAPTDDQDEFQEWLNLKGEKRFLEKSESRDFEIVDVSEVTE